MGSFIEKCKKKLWYIARYIHLRLMPRRLWTRAFLIIVLPVVLIQTVSGFIFYDNHWQSVSRRLALGIANDINSILVLCRVFPLPADQETILLTARQYMGLYIKFLPPQDAPRQKLSLKTEIMTSELIPALDIVGYPFVVQNMPKQYSVRILFYLPEMTMEIFLPYKKFFSSTTYIFGLWVLVTSFLFLGVAVLFLRNQIRPILKLAGVAENFGLSRDVEKFKPEGATEVRQAGIAFVQMRDRILRHIEDRTRMLAGVSHDLRTPLTRMRLQLAMMGEDDTIQELSKDVLEMEQMLNGYLAFVRGEGKEVAEEIDLNALISQTVQSMRKEGTVINYKTNALVRMIIRKNDFKRCLWNLITNACRYGDKVLVSMDVKDKSVEISIEDNGPGIPPEKREDVFKPFFRLDDSRNVRTGGVGLGLTITRDIILSHGGKISMQESTLGGLKVLLVLPR